MKCILLHDSKTGKPRIFNLDYLITAEPAEDGGTEIITLSDEYFCVKEQFKTIESACDIKDLMYHPSEVTVTPMKSPVSFKEAYEDRITKDIGKDNRSKKKSFVRKKFKHGKQMSDQSK